MACCQCYLCSRNFEVSELYRKMVEAKKIPVEDVLCGSCDKSNDEGGEN
jgi:hypothetical protein